MNCLTKYKRLSSTSAMYCKCPLIKGYCGVSRLQASILNERMDAKHGSMEVYLEGWCNKLGLLIFLTIEVKEPLHRSWPLPYVNH